MARAGGDNVMPDRARLAVRENERAGGGACLAVAVQPDRSAAERHRGVNGSDADGSRAGPDAAQASALARRDGPAGRRLWIKLGIGHRAVPSSRQSPVQRPSTAGGFREITAPISALETAQTAARAGDRRATASYGRPTWPGSAKASMHGLCPGRAPELACATAISPDETGFAVTKLRPRSRRTRIGLAAFERAGFLNDTATDLARTGSQPPPFLHRSPPSVFR